MEVQKKVSSLKINLLRTIIKIFKLFGLAPFSTNIFFTDTKKKIKIIIKKSFIGSLYNLLLSLYFVIIIYASQSLKSLKIGYVNYLVQFFLLIIETLISTIITIYYCVQQRKIIKLIINLSKWEKKLIDIKNINKIKIHKYNSHIIVIIIYLIITLTVLVISCIKRGKFELSSIVSSLPTIIIGCTVIQYMLIVIHLQRRFKYINDLFKQFKLINEDYCDVYDVNYVKVISLLSIDRNLYKLLRDTVDFYSLPILFIIGHFCLTLSYTFYLWIICVFNYGHKDFALQFILQTIWIIRIIYPIICFILCVTKISTEVI